ncbi:MAG: hypothetical protein ACRDQA_22555 [Nocardioidaceae bacterium]
MRFLVAPALGQRLRHVLTLLAPVDDDVSQQTLESFKSHELGRRQPGGCFGGAEGI